MISVDMISYPRSKGLSLLRPQRQTIVLFSESTIKELCSNTTPTSQFSSLHFIASKAIGAKSIERRAQTLDTELGWAAKRQRGTPDTFWRRLRFTRLLHTADTAVTLAPRRNGGWRLNRTRASPVTLLLCYGGSTSYRESP